MSGINTTKLAEELGLSKGRISQLVGDGRLAGCYSGDGRARRFDLAKCKVALKRRLDPGQMMGNGSGTRRKLQDDGDSVPPQVNESAPLLALDPDRYELARTQKAEEEARRLRRMNAEAEGEYLLASSVQREVANRMAQEIAEFETFMRDAASTIADRMGVEYREVRAVLTEAWREHRSSRSAALAESAGQAGISEEELAKDI